MADPGAPEGTAASPTGPALVPLCDCGPLARPALAKPALAKLGGGGGVDEQLGSRQLESEHLEAMAKPPTCWF
jgi:hypothetical protein